MSGTKNADLLPMPDLDEILGMHGRQFVRSVYRRLLVREPEASGIVFYLRRMEEGFPRIQILAEIASSKEARSLAVKPPGLAHAMMLHRLSRLPLVGRFIGRILGVEGGSRLERRLGTLEAQLHADPPDANPAQEMTDGQQQQDRRALVASSSLFDAEWYRKQLPILGDEIDLIDHYLRTGGIEGRSPSEGFDGGMYLARYFDVKRSGMNPLLHFLRYGKMEGRRRFTVAEAREHRLRQTKFPVNQEIHCLKVPRVSGELAVLVTRATDGKIRPFVRHYAVTLMRHGIGVIPIIAADRPVISETPETMVSLSGLFVRESQGDPVAAWAHVLQLYPDLFSASILYLLDDSAFGPVNEEKFARLIERIRSSDADMIEWTASNDDEKQARAYFRALKPKALSSVAFNHYVRDVIFAAENASATLAAAGELAARLRGSGFKVEDLRSSPVLPVVPEHAGGALLKWKELVGLGLPFIDAATLREARTGADWPRWQQFLDKEGWDKSLAEGELADRATPVGADSVSPDAGFVVAAGLVGEQRAGASLPLRVAFIGPWNFDGAPGIASRGYLSALWQTGFLLNVHPIRSNFHHRRRMTLTVDCRSFSGDADLAIVNLNPDEWPGFLAEDHWEILSCARKVVGAWACEQEAIPPTWHPAIDVVDAIWAPSRYCADLFERSTRVSVEVVPHCINIRVPYDASTTSQLLRDKIGIASNQRVIASCLDTDCSSERFNLLGLIAAFDSSGLSRENWVLLICAGNSSPLTPEARKVRDKSAETPAVFLIDTPLDPASRSALLNSADIFAAPHRSEYSGLPIVEAMAHGKVVVATDFGGGRDILDATCGYPVPYVLRSVHDDLCAEVDIESLAGILRKAAKRIAAGDLSIGQEARQRVVVQNSPGVVAQSMQRAAAMLLEVR